jgi:branched-subunit amino acid ABC-type transport system permease component
MYLVNFALGSALAGGAGALWASIYSFSPHSGRGGCRESFIVAILGGSGISGALRRRNSARIAETAGVSFFGAEWQESLGMV